jgi:hypothetical protein
MSALRMTANALRQLVYAALRYFGRRTPVRTVARTPVRTLARTAVRTAERVVRSIPLAHGVMVMCRLVSP